MDQDDFEFFDSTGSKTSDVVAAHDVDHAGTHGSRNGCHRDRRETEARKDHVAHNIAEAFGEIAHTHNRQKIHFNVNSAKKFRFTVAIRYALRILLELAFKHKSIP